jgi:hypothetical protein
MVITIGEARAETKEWERTGLLRERLENLIAVQEEKLGMNHFGTPKLVVAMRGYNEPCHQNGEIILEYWDEEYLYHELGHFYLGELCKKLNVDLSVNNKEITQWFEARNQFISEGIATYFGREMTGEEANFNDSEYPKTIGEFLRNKFNFLLRLYYGGGYHLFKPILDKFGVEEGCKRIILHLPKKEEMVELPVYRRKILGELAY